MVPDYNESILRSLRRITRAIDQYSKQLAKTYKITTPQLVCIRYLDKVGNASPGQIAHAALLSQATVTGILDRLEQQQIVARERSSDDKRRVTVKLLEKGMQISRSAPPPLHNLFSQRLARLPGRECELIDSILRRIVEMMEASEINAVPLMSSGPMDATHSEVTEFLGSEQEGSSAADRKGVEK